jgi:hypothetical protein
MANMVALRDICLAMLPEHKRSSLDPDECIRRFSDAEHGRKIMHIWALAALMHFESEFIHNNTKASFSTVQRSTVLPALTRVFDEEVAPQNLVNQVADLADLAHGDAVTLQSKLGAAAANIKKLEEICQRLDIPVADDPFLKVMRLNHQISTLAGGQFHTLARICAGLDPRLVLSAVEKASLQL